MTVTIRDLAEKLNLSITTVSRAIDGYHDVAEETRKRVIRAAEEIGYEPSYAARQLRRKRAGAIGYILPTHIPRFSDPFYTSFLTGLCDEAAAQGLDLIISSSPPGSEQEKKEYRRWVQSQRVDGVVINRTRVQDWRLDYLSENKIPFVTFGKDPSNANHPCIYVDDRSGMRQMVTHLAQRGHQKIAFIGAPSDLVIQIERLAGYRQGLEEAGLPFQPGLVLTADLTEQGGHQAGRALLELEDAPTAIIGVNDLTALGVLHAAHEKGIEVGSHLAVAGYDGIDETAYSSPPLTTIYQPTYDIACQLARMLIQVIDSKPITEQTIVVQPSLLMRASTG